MTTVVFFLEELSARELLKGFVPRILGSEVDARYIVFEGKQDLEKQLVRKIRGWQAPDSVFVVLRDQDAGDCRKVKHRLADLVREAGRPALVRVACKELESWIAGDLRAVAQAFERPKIESYSKRKKFRDPDRLVRPVEVLRELVPEYQKVDGARRVGVMLDPDKNSSQSFVIFCSGLRLLVA